MRCLYAETSFVCLTSLNQPKNNNEWTIKVFRKMIAKRGKNKNAEKSLIAAKHKIQIRWLPQILDP